MEWKLGARSRPSWRTLNLHRILEQFELQQINGACTTTFPRFPLLSLPLHYFQFYHILNIPTYTLNNRCPQCQTILIYTTILLGTLRTTSFSRFSYIALLATMALDSPSSPAGTTHGAMTQPATSAPMVYTHGHVQPEQNGVTDMSDSSV